MIRKYILVLFLLAVPLQAQTVTPTYYESGVESPWLLGIDYDLGFSKFFSFNLAVLGGISSQVNKASTFGDVYFGEVRTGVRLYMNKADEWRGVFLEVTGRYGVYNLPLRSGPTNTVIFSRSNAFLLGVGLYLGYRWKRALVADMRGLPFHMALEPYFGYTFDTFIPLDSGISVGSAHRFSLGLKFTLGFYTYKYRPGTTVTNEETGEITRKENITNTPASNIQGSPPRVTNARGLPLQSTNTQQATNGDTNRLPASTTNRTTNRVTNLQSSTGYHRRTFAMKDPWEYII